VKVRERFFEFLLSLADLEYILRILISHREKEKKVIKKPRH
jgi:hypothetical protein